MTDKNRGTLVLMIFLIALSSSCMQHPDAFYFKVAPIPHTITPGISLNVGLVLTEKFKTETWFWDEHKITYHIGDVFCTKAIEIASAAFSGVTVLGEKTIPPGSNIDAFLVPELVSFEKTRPVFGPGNQICTAMIKWTLTDLKDELIWVDTIKAECESPMAIGVGKAMLTFDLPSALKRGSDKQMALLSEQFFFTSIETIHASDEIKNFSRATP